MTNDPNSWSAEAGSEMKVGDVFTEAWLDRYRELMTAYNAAKRALVLADEYLGIGEGVGLRYYFYDFPTAMAEFNAALEAADVELPSDKPPAD